MTFALRLGIKLAILSSIVATLVMVSHLASLAQNSAQQQKIAQIKQALAKNQQALSQYTWQMTQTVSVKGDLKNSEMYQVEMGPGGQLVKVPITATPAPGGRPFGIRHRITEDYENYGKQIAALGASYSQPDPGKLQQLYAAGDVSIQSGGAPGLLAVVVNNYVKSGDKVTLTFNQAQKAIISLNIATYNSGPSDVVTIAVQFARLPDGTNHVATVNVNGQSKSMVIQQQNMNYQKRSQ